MQSLRGPIFEDKVVDYVLELANVSEREVEVDELVKAAAGNDDEGNADGGNDDGVNEDGGDSGGGNDADNDGKEGSGDGKNA